MFKRILVAIDGSSYSQEALPAAIEMAKKFDSEILFCTRANTTVAGPSFTRSRPLPWLATMTAASAVKQLRNAGLTAKGQLVDVAAGHVAKAIVETANAKGIDLIVMGSRGLSECPGDHARQRHPQGHAHGRHSSSGRQNLNREAGDPEWCGGVQRALSRSIGAVAQHQSGSVDPAGGHPSTWEAEVLDCLPDGVVVVDEAGRIVYCNRQAERLTGYRRGELMGRPIELLVPASLRARHRQDRRDYALRPRPRPMGPADRDFRLRRKDGSEHIADIALGPFVDRAATAP